MASYYDSSLLLAAVLGQVTDATLADLWDGETVRVTSALLEVECTIGLRRVEASSGRAVARSRLAERMAAVQPYFDGLTVKFVDEDVLTVLRGEPRLARCRALDAIHLATALFFQPHLGMPLRICTLDKGMRTVAAELGFPVAPLV